MKIQISLFLLSVVLLTQLSFSASCYADVDSISLDLVVRDYTGEGYVEMPLETVELYDYSSIYNHTRIYFAAYDSSELCSTNCGTPYSTNFLARLIVIGENNGDFVEVFNELLSEGNITSKITSENKTFALVVNNYYSVVSCSKVEGGDFCSDGTQDKHCSVYKPYRCEKDKDDKYNLVRSPENCGTSVWDKYGDGCLYGFRTFCDSKINALMNSTCINNEWHDSFVVDCDDFGVPCVINGPNNASCFEYQNIGACSDGTPKGGCSKNSPKYCNDVGVLIDSPKICGCPSNAIYEPTTLSCVYFECKDGTDVETCSSTLPLYCNDEGELIEKASECGCPDEYEIEGENCNEVETEVEVIEPEETIDNETLENDTSVPLPTTTTPNTTSAPPDTTASLPEEPDVVEEQTEDEEIPRDFIYLGAIAILVGVAAYQYFKTQQPKKKHKKK